MIVLPVETKSIPLVPYERNWAQDGQDIFRQPDLELYLQGLSAFSKVLQVFAFPSPVWRRLVRVRGRREHIKNRRETSRSSTIAPPV
jgi:hypothetical protein